jgi:hypothetical protein
MHYFLFYGSLMTNRLTNVVSDSSHLARVNGAGAAFSCLARSIGPLITGPLFDFSQKKGLTPLPFWILGLVSALAFAQSWLLTDHA